MTQDHFPKQHKGKYFKLHPWSEWLPGDVKWFSKHGRWVHLGPSFTPCRHQSLLTPVLLCSSFSNNFMKIFNKSLRNNRIHTVNRDLSCAPWGSSAHRVHALLLFTTKRIPGYFFVYYMQWSTSSISEELEEVLLWQLTIYLPKFSFLQSLYEEVLVC